MFKSYKFFLCLATLIFLLFTDLSVSIAEIYQWEDFSKPFKKKTDRICRTKPNQIEVFLPNLMKNFESVTLIVRIDVDTVNPGRPYLIINNFNRDPYRIKSDQDNLIAIKTKHLKTGINAFSFYDNLAGCNYASFLIKLRFDIPNMAEIDSNITNKIESEKTNKLNTVPNKEIDTNEEKSSVIGTRWAVVIGISLYQDTRIPSLRYASKDAQSFYNWLISPTGGQYAPARVKFLIDEQATGNRIRASLFEWLGQVLEEDIVTIFFAGHGSPQSPDNPENLFLLPYDVKYDSIASTGFPMWDIETALERFIKAKKVIVIADACHAGGVGKSFDVARRAGRGINVVPISSNLQNLSKIGDGICIISASDDNQYSQESQKWGGGHGVFTYYLLQGLKGEADYSKDKKVSLGEIIPYLSEQVRRATRNAQTPTVAGRFDPALTIGK